MGKHFQFVWLCVSSIKTGTRRIMRLGELSLVVRLSRRISKYSSSRLIMRLKYKNGAGALSLWTDNASSSIKAVILMLFSRHKTILKTSTLCPANEQSSLFLFQQTDIADVKNILSERIRRNSQSGKGCTTVCPRGPPGPEGKGVIDQLLS